MDSAYYVVPGLLSAWFLGKDRIAGSMNAMPTPWEPSNNSRARDKQEQQQQETAASRCTRSTCTLPRQRSKTTSAMLFFGSFISSMLCLRTGSMIRGVIVEFKRDASAITSQITSRVKRDVKERYVASLVEIGGTEGRMGVANWARLTDEWVASNPHGVIAYAPLMRGEGALDEYRAVVEESYPEIAGGIPVYRYGRDGGLEELTNIEDDLLPALYVNPPQLTLLGADFKHAVLGRVGGRIAKTSDTVISEAVLSRGIDHPVLTVMQPVFATADANGDAVMVGAVAKTLKAARFVADALATMGFTETYPDADVAVFLRAGEETQLLFDLERYPKGLQEAFRTGKVTPSCVERRGLASFSAAAELVGGKEIVVVASFSPRVGRLVILALFSVSSLVNLIFILVLYWGQARTPSQERCAEKQEGVESAALTFKSRFMADMSHEICTPLNGIVGTTDLLADEPLTPAGRELLDAARLKARDLTNIVNDFLEYSKIDTGQLKVEARPTHLREIFHQAMEMIMQRYPETVRGKGLAVAVAAAAAPSPSTSLHLNLAESVPEATVFTDSVRLQQVIERVTSNALKFTKRGSVTVAARLEPLKCVTPLGESQGALAGLFSRNKSFGLGQIAGDQSPGENTIAAPGFLRSMKAVVPNHTKAMFLVEVKDTGVGIAPDQICRLFKPFSQVHSNPDRAVSGTGLGLAICKALCESMGGEIDCRSAPGQGTTVRFSVLVGVDSPSSIVSSSGDDSCKTAACAGLLNDGAPRLGTPRFNRFRAPVASSAKQGNMTTAPDTSSKIKALLQQRLQPTQKERQLYLKQSPQWYHHPTQVSPKAYRRSSVVEKNRHGRASRVDHTIFATATTASPSSESSFDDSTDLAKWAHAGFHQHHLWTDPRERKAPFNKTVVDTDGNCLGRDATVVGAEDTTPLGSAQVIRRQPRFLVVDDQRINRLLVRKMLNGFGAHVREEEDGARAVEACRDSSYDMILMDIMMPVLDGLEASVAIREDDKGSNNTTPIIAITANPFVEGTLDEYNICDALYKPITRQNLFAMVTKWAKEEHISWMALAQQKQNRSLPESRTDNIPERFPHHKGALL